MLQPDHKANQGNGRNDQTGKEVGKLTEKAIMGEEEGVLRCGLRHEATNHWTDNNSNAPTEGYYAHTSTFVCLISDICHITFRNADISCKVRE